MILVRWQRLLALGVGLLALACGDENGVTPPPPPGESAPPTAAVSVNDFNFSPKDVTIKTGGTVTWTWKSGNVAPHNVNYNGGPTPWPANSTTKVAGTHESIITTVGQYTYRCTLHQGMTGTVTVVN